eukprot:TRINITY_DN9090_c2_g1_i1.p1 TRINITY_DN9090_c2_g1~~TRINITY_DN9090_c2_g1_i1.p1  ORF type:complete len:231 (-),score=2.14 TRINITY_DN9090_c2_g1_i1:991-1683(-)
MGFGPIDKKTIKEVQKKRKRKRKKQLLHGASKEVANCGICPPPCCCRILLFFAGFSCFFFSFLFLFLFPPFSFLPLYFVEKIIGRLKWRRIKGKGKKKKKKREKKKEKRKNVVQPCLGVKAEKKKKSFVSTRRPMENTLSEERKKRKRNWKLCWLLLANRTNQSKTSGQKERETEPVAAVVFKNPTKLAILKGRQRVARGRRRKERNSLFFFFFDVTCWPLKTFFFSPSW